MPAASLINAEGAEIAEGAENGMIGFSALSAVLRVLCVSSVAVLPAAGCRQDMHDQPKYRPLRKSEFFSDQRSARPLVPGTVARGTLRDETPLYTGKVAGQFTPALPVSLSEELLKRGRVQFETFCAPCHGRVGRGDGMVVTRGFKAPTSFHVDRLRQMPIGYFFDVMTNGFGAMSDYAAQVRIEDRWAIAAYIRVLQISQHATLADVPPEERARLSGAPAAPAPAPEAHP
jgi:mono/diheme cytochrome c family protein